MTKTDQIKSELKEPAFILAMTMLVGFLLIIGRLLFISDSSLNLESVKILSGVFGGWIGTIIGYYFGQKPVKGLTERVEDLTKTQTTTIQKYDDASKELSKTKEEAVKIRAKFSKVYEALSDLYEVTEKEKTK